MPRAPHSNSPVLAEVDRAMVAAGLTRSPRHLVDPAARRARFPQANPEELTRRSDSPVVDPNGVHWLPVPGWRQLPWLWQGFSTRKTGASYAYCAEEACGELNLGFTGDDSRDAVVQNRLSLAEAITGERATPLVNLRQIHSSLIRDASTSKCEPPCRGDGLMTSDPGILLAVMTADCVPVLVADRKKRAVAAFHAGWRGTVQRIVENGIGRMCLEFGSAPEDMIAAIGPSIGPCCYAVGQEVYSSFESQFSYFAELFHEVFDSDPIRNRYPMLFLTQRAPGHSPIGPSLHLDLVEANRRQLLAAGVPSSAIKVVGGCTACQPELFFSHRGMQGRAGRMMAVIGIREGAPKRRSRA